ncbi:MAG: tetratricopeptide repeat protein [Spongiibacteraceae bacterium]|nr:tetratricopeptide repeat protein [Spongiibacteraceae bacterium]
MAMMMGPKPQWVKHSVKLCFTIALLILMVISTFTHALEEGEIPNEVQDLHYGVVLYHFYQQSYFDALTESLVGEEKSSMPFHAKSAKLLRGGMSLSYGMGNKAEEIFTQVLDAIGSAEQKDRAWFYLGKLYYIRSDKKEAQQAFSHVNGSTLKPELRDELIYYTAKLQLRDGQSEQADTTIAQLTEKSPWFAYYHFNRGAAQVVSGNWEQGVQQFALIKNSSLEGSEGLTLKDRAFIASGFAHLGAGEYDSAIDDFVSVRMNSPLVERAMLGYGWAAAQQEDYKKALAPWQALSQRSLLNTSVQESLLAIPFAYEKLNVPVSALTQYVRAVDVFENELGTVKDAIVLFRDEPISAVITDSSSLDSDWIDGDEYLPLSKQAPYLAQLIAQDHFQVAIDNHNDLMRTARFLQRAKQRFIALNGVLTLQKKIWQESLDSGLREKYREGYEALLLMQASLQKQMILAEQEGDGRRLLDPEAQALWLRAEQAANRIQVLREADVDVSEEMETLRLYRGLLSWQASEDYSIKQWEFKQQFVALQEQIDQAKEKLEKLEQFSNDRFELAFAERMVSMEQRIDQQQIATDVAIAQSEGDIRQLAVAQLQKQQQRLTYYLGQAKLAIARLYDAGSGVAQ